jgi:ribonuclease P protein subunit POP4
MLHRQRFSLFVPLHHLWLGYMSELLGLPNVPPSHNAPPTAKSIPNAASMHAKLVKADFHGSIMTGTLPLALIFPTRIYDF